MDQQASFQINVPGIFSFVECAWFLDRNYDDCTHTVSGDTIRKALPDSSGALLTEIRKREEGLNVTLLQGAATLGNKARTGAYIRDWLDLDRDIAPFYELLRKEKKLAYMAEAFYGLRLIGIPDLFEALCWSITGQQINLSFAFRLKRRLTERYGKKILFGETPYYLFPEPAVLATAPLEELRDMQFSQRKAEYITGLAAVFAAGELSKEIVAAMPSFAARQQALTALRGIGIWTANYGLMKSLRVTEAIPYGDAGLLQALVSHDLIKDRKDQAGIDRLFRKFSGWETYLVCYLWRSLAVPA